MGRFLLLALGVVLLIAVGVALTLGAFPPSPHTEQVQRVLPNDKFTPTH
jgi:Tfp pilus assembly protein PilN